MNTQDRTQQDSRDRPNEDLHDQSEATGTQKSMAEAAGERDAQRQKSAGKLASGPPPAVQRAAVQKSVGRLASGAPPAAPQSRGEQPE